MKARTLAAIGLALLCVGGCTNYYKVTDPTTGRVYYTDELQHKNSGAATLKDGRTGDMVNIQNSDVEKITKEDYDVNRLAPPPAPPVDPATTNPFH